MFDIGFWELVLVGIVALLVVGPKDLPGLVQSVGRGIGKAKGFLNAMKSDLNYEIDKANELKRLMEKESEIAELHRVLKNNVAQTLEQSALADVSKVEQADGITTGAYPDQRPEKPFVDQPKVE